MGNAPFQNEDAFDGDFTTYPANERSAELEDTSGEDKITRPFNPTLIRVDTRIMTIDLLLSRIGRKELNLQPSFQREGGIWNNTTQSRLIESMLIRIPLPAFYMDGTNENKWLIVDGLQRLTALKYFMLDKTLKLNGMEFLSNLNGKIYTELSRPLQRRIMETQVTVYLIQKGTPKEVKFNIYKRINTGGLPLSPQEIRHALNQGKATNVLEQLANSEEFQRAIAGGIRNDRMTDRECVLRFFAFTITPYTNYKSQEFDSFLNDGMEVMNTMADKQLKYIGDLFKKTMIVAYDLFDDDAFRKRYKAGGPRYKINKALFESWSVNLSQLNNEQIVVLKARKELLKERFVLLMQDRNFDTAVSQGTGDIKKVIYRFDTIRGIIEEVIR